MNKTENNEVTINNNDYLKLIALLSCKFQSKLSIIASLVGAGIATYAIKSFGIHSVGGMVVGIFFGLSVGTFIDLVRLQIRVAKALALVVQKSNET